MAPDRSVAWRLLAAMGAAGVDSVFGLPGVHNLAFWRQGPSDALPRLVNVRHEQTAVYAADGFARASGRPGFALVTTGPGAANAVAAFGEAAASKSPVVLVASEVPRRVTASGVRGALHQSADQAGMFRALAKATYSPRTAADAVAMFAEALATAMAPPQGPVYVDVPTDVFDEAAPAVDGRAAAGPAVGPPHGDDAGDLALASAAARIDAAPQVAIWAGGGVVQAGATAALARLAEHLCAPVFTTFSSRGALPPDHPSTVSLPPHEPEIENLLAAADVLVVVGSDLDGMTTKNLSLRLPPTLVNVNADPQRLPVPGREVTGVGGDAGWALAGLAEMTSARSTGLTSAVPGACRAAWARLRADPRTAEACRFVATVQSAAAGRATVVNDMTIPGYWLAGYFVADRPRSLQYPMGWGTLGYALPAAVGAARGSTRPVLAVCGDGGVMFALGELATLVEERAAVTALVIDDGGYGMLRFDQREAENPRGVDLLAPDFLRLADAFGMEAVDVDGVGDALGRALTDALASGGPRLVHCTASLFPPKTTSPRWAEP